MNSAQDYLTAQKRRIVAASFAAVPPPPHRRYNYVYLSVLANKETRYNKVAYPQTLSLAPGGQITLNGVFSGGSVPGGVYTSAGALITQASQAGRPTVSDCTNCPTVPVNSAPAGSLV